MQIGRYEVEGEIGRGGAGVVLRGKGPDGRSVAIKVLRTALSDETRARFAREERLLETLGAADGFVPLLERGDSPQGPYLVMPFLPGGTLRAKIAKGPLEIEETLRILRRVAAALGAAHAKGIVHRDVKPDNVLFDEHGEPFLADLGLAKHFAPGAPGASQSVSISKADEYRGSVRYSSPEQLTGSKDVGPTADVFALGAVLFECLTGTVAFPGESTVDIVRRVARGDVEDPRRLRPETPKWLAGVVKRALAPAPDTRYPDGAAFAEALTEASSDSRGRTTALAVIAFLAAAGTIGFLAGRLVGGPAPPPTVPGLPGSDDEPSAAAWIARAEREAKKGELETAKRSLSHAIDKDPGSAAAWLARGQLRLETKDLEAALPDLEKAIQLDPKLSKAWAARGTVRFELKDYAGSITDLAHALELEPARSKELVPLYVRALERRGAIRGKDGKFDDALADFELALKHDPKLALAWQGRAEILWARKQLAEAITNADRAIELDPALARAHYVRGLVRLFQRDFEAASNDFTKCTELDPKFPGGWGDLAAARDMLQDYDGAERAAQRAVDLDPVKMPASWSTLARVKYHKKDWRGAVNAATHAIELAPANLPIPDAYMTRAECRMELGDPKAAIADASRLIEIRPSFGYGWYIRGCARLIIGDRDGGAGDLNRARNLDASLDPQVKPKLALIGR